jgi:small-conductance mechanosensitive channel
VTGRISPEVNATKLFARRKIATAFAVLAIFAGGVCAEDRIHEYPVKLDGKVLFTIKASRAQYSPEERARDTSSDIVAAAENDGIPAYQIRQIEGENETILLAGRSFLMAVSDEDARLEQRSREALAQERTRIIAAAIADYRHARAPLVLVRRIVLALLTWATLAVLLLLLHRGSKQLVAGIGRSYQRFLASRNLPGFHLYFLPPVLKIATIVVRCFFVLVALGSAMTAASYSMGLFPQTAGISREVRDHLAGAIGAVARSFIGYLPDLTVVLAVIAITYGLIRALNSLTKAVESEAISIPGFATEWAAPTNRLLAFMLIMIGLVVVFPYLPGGDSPAFRGISIFIGVLVSLGSGSAMGNLVAGVILTYMRPFRIGDRVKISETVGDVLDRSLLVTRLRTVKNVEIIIPNAMVLGAHILNYSTVAREEGLILSVSLTIGYKTPWPTVHRLLIEAALGANGILTAPWPFVLQKDLNDSHVTYELNVFTNEAGRMERIYSELRERIQNTFNQAGVEIMSPAYVAVRDGNAVTIPGQSEEAHSSEPAFHVRLDRNGGTQPARPRAAST